MQSGNALTWLVQVTSLTRPGKAHPAVQVDREGQEWMRQHLRPPALQAMGMQPQAHVMQPRKRSADLRRRLPASHTCAQAGIATRFMNPARCVPWRWCTAG